MIGHDDFVRVRDDAPAQFWPGRQGSVATLFIVEEPRYARSLNVELGTRMIGIESDDGSLVEVPASYVVKLA